MTDLRTPLARARGLGSAKEGVAHWWAQRATALALIPLSLWFVGSVIGLIGASHAVVSAWIASPVSAVLLILLLGATLHHAQLGCQVVIEDYVHGEGAKVALILVVKSLAIVVFTAAAFAVLRLATG
jgi:succinate dehydrogenase / fumarate reductase membrane anchor subunit